MRSCESAFGVEALSLPTHGHSDAKLHREQRMDGIISQERLGELTGLTQKAALLRHLRNAGIPFREINGRILTTEEAITAALVGRAKKRQGPNLDAID